MDVLYSQLWNSCVAPFLTFDDMFAMNLASPLTRACIRDPLIERAVTLHGSFCNFPTTCNCLISQTVPVRMVQWRQNLSQLYVETLTKAEDSTTVELRFVSIARAKYPETCCVNCDNFAMHHAFFKNRIRLCCACSQLKLTRWHCISLAHTQDLRWMRMWYADAQVEKHFKDIGSGVSRHICALRGLTNWPRMRKYVLEHNQKRLEHDYGGFIDIATPGDLERKLKFGMVPHNMRAAIAEHLHPFVINIMKLRRQSRKRELHKCKSFMELVKERAARRKLRKESQDST